jgi:hypothetical protein
MMKEVLWGRGPGYWTGMGKGSSAWKVVVCVPERCLLGRPVRKWDDDIEMDIKLNGLFVSFRIGAVTICCGRENALSGYTKFGELLINKGD